MNYDGVQETVYLLTLLDTTTHSHASVVKVLLENDANVNVQDSRGDSALLVASCAGSEAIVRMLLERGGW